MNERTKQLLDDAVRYGIEAWKEWAESFKDSPPSHMYTLLLGGLVVTVGRWFL